MLIIHACDIEKKFSKEEEDLVCILKTLFDQTKEEEEVGRWKRKKIAVAGGKDRNESPKESQKGRTSKKDGGRNESDHCEEGEKHPGRP